jgi:hypothetical protein
LQFAGAPFVNSAREYLSFCAIANPAMNVILMHRIIYVYSRAYIIVSVCSIVWLMFKYRKHLNCMNAHEFVLEGRVLDPEIAVRMKRDQRIIQWVTGALFVVWMILLLSLVVVSNMK